MKFVLTLNLMLAVVSAGTGPVLKQRLPLVPVMPIEELKDRVIGGQEATRNQFPYQASLMWTSTSTYSSHICSGTLISNSTILTSAKCVYKVDGITVLLGTNDIKDSNETGHQKIYITKSNIYVHDGWNPVTFKNDIALIRLPNAVEFSDSIQPAALPKNTGQYPTYEGEKVWASAWGRESLLLLFIEASVLNQNTCRTFYFGQVTEQMICIGVTGGLSCNGDSGGPLVYKEDGVNYLIGIRTFDIALGCNFVRPGVFTRITSYLNWIKKKSSVVNK